MDILAEFRTGIIPIRLMVECKDYVDRNVGIDELKKFAGALDGARGRAVDKGLMVASFGFTMEAKAFADQRGIETITYAQLSTQLVDFSDYLAMIISEYQESPVSRLYVELSGSRSEEYAEEETPLPRRRLTDIVDQDLLRSEQRRLALLGNFGTGKTTFCRRYAAVLAERYRTDATVRIPVLIRLSDYEAKLDIQELITNTLQFRYGVRIDIGLCEELQRLGRFLLILDGLDEMAAKVDADTIRENLREINKAARIPENKIVLTCRTHFFRDRVQAEVLGEFDLIFIPEWGESELELYLKLKFGPAWHASLERINGTHNLAELAQTPLFLEMIVETLAGLGSGVSRVELYRAYTQKWIRQQSDRRGARLGSGERAALALELAVKLYKEDRPSCHFSEFTEMIRQRYDVSDAAQIDYLHSDIRNCTFLTRDPGGNYSFRHNSFKEFFVAEKIAEDLAVGETSLLGVRILPLEVSRFLLDILKAAPVQVAFAKCLSSNPGEILEQNLFALAARLRVDIGDNRPRTSDASETGLFSRFVQGDAEAFNELYEKHYGSLFSFINRILSDRGDCEDVVAESYVKLWTARDRIDRVDRLRPFLFTIARNLALDRLRRRERLITADLPDDLAMSVSNENQIVAQIDLEAMLSELPGLEQEILRELYLLGLSVAECAEKYGLSTASVQAIASIAKQRLRRLLARSAVRPE